LSFELPLTLAPDFALSPGDQNHARGNGAREMPERISMFMRKR
jgi:hypothetical protein